ncbi:Carboxylesterase [Lachnellula hyalina]|uniref:Carboxylesterase n=1 Tax=Lachnellula hyalina TaxID=1316788 RepID=A0A8H8QUX8_9HELO|nr:Carboxylesterase [Lachnellula hyalina]TVY22981.1 Carboxylesterase [Lachnellula hyalina]
MAPIIILKEPPALDPAWLAHERTANLLAPKPITTDPTERQRIYSETCKARNTSLLSNQDKALNDGIFIQDSFIKALEENHSIPIRCYSSNSPHDPESKAAQNTIIYYHGGGLTVGDLDSEDLSCRRISKTLQCTVYSIAYRLMPQHSADDALADALTAFRHISQTPQLTNGKLVLVGSSSGGQLAAQVSQFARRGNGESGESTCRVDGVLLRCPVTCDAANLPARFRDAHVSMDVAFHTSLLSAPALTVENRTVEKLPLEEEGLRGLPRHWVQVCTNDVYYSDGVCYVEALREQGVDVRVDMVVGWPHTFWLKAPRLERAVEAERDMVEGLRWLLEG